jgi:hypothetical protein
MRNLLWIFGLLLLATPGLAGEFDEIVGEWEMSLGPRGGRQATLVLEEKDGELSGTWTSERGSVKLRDLTYQDGQLSFSMTGKGEAGEVTLSFSGGLESDELKGELDTPRGAVPASGTRK